MTLAGRVALAILPAGHPPLPLAAPAGVSGCGWWRLGASSAFVESTLGQIYKEKIDASQYRGGPAFYIEKAWA